MFGTISEEIQVNVPADKAWKLYGTLQLAEIVTQYLSHLVSKIEVLQGDGGAGTILQVFFTPDMPGMTSYKEKYTVVDNDRRVKEAEVIEGGYLDMGFTLYRIRLEVVEKEGENENGCITRATIEYEVKEDETAKYVSIETLVAIMQAARDHLIRNQNI